MTQATPTFKQIKAQVAAIRTKIKNPRNIAIHSKTKWTGETRHEDGGETYLIHQCDSPLAMRLALRQGGASVITVLITSLDEREIAADILVRLKPRKLVPLDSWQIVKAMFQARAIDPRIIEHRWIADSLMELIPTEGFPPVASGFLDAETVWAILLHRLLGLNWASPDLLAILKWSTDPDHVARFRKATPEFRVAAMKWLATSAGSTVVTVLGCVFSNERADALPIGLAAGVVFHERATGKLERAAGKLEERYLGGQAPSAVVIERWAAASTEVARLQLSDGRLKQQLLHRADEILREVDAESFAWVSDTSPKGFDLRFAELGKRLTQSLSKGSATGLDLLAASRQSIVQHDRHSSERRRLERVDMAIRLVRWLLEGDQRPAPQSLAEAARQHLAEGGYVDWARLTLRAGDPVRELAESYAKLFDSVTSIRERQSQRFAELLRDWTASKTTDDLIVPVEQALERIVAPIAAHKPVLVLLIDGMSVAVFRELIADALGHDWVLLAEDAIGLRPALATVPSVTEVSRTSLMCGRLTQGNSATEKAGFAEHPALLRTCRSGSPPVLFHKAALQESEDASLAGDIRREISSSHRRIVGVVVNAVDDHLLKGEQIDTRWTRDEIKVLPVLLHEAKSVGRIVVMLSDHGHVLDCNAKGQVFEGGERWRMDEGAPAEGELRIAGPRVVMPESKSLIAPWTERVRFGVKKNGYHGGVSPQEMVVPIAVLSSPDDFPAGWIEADDDTPAWWDLTASSVGAAARPILKRKPPRPKVVPSDLLFDIDEEPQPQPVVSADVADMTPEWITTLLSSPVFEEQKRLCGRAAPTNDVLTRLLIAIDGRGGKITSPALARSIQFSAMRLPGLLAVAQRLLNVDGFPVLTRDDASDTVILERNLLCRQFDLV